MEKYPWIKVGIAFGNDHNAVVVCPDCCMAQLKCVDLLLPSETRKEFHIYRPDCGAEQYMRK